MLMIVVKIGDFGLCRQLNDDTNETFGVIPYLALEILSGKPYTKESFWYDYVRTYYRRDPLNILEGKRPEITKDIPEFYVDLMKKCRDPKPENRPNVREIRECLWKYYHQLSEEKR